MVFTVTSFFFSMKGVFFSMEKNLWLVQAALITIYGKPLENRVDKKDKQGKRRDKQDKRLT